MKKRFWMIFKRSSPRPDATVWGVFKNGSLDISDQYTSANAAIKKATELAASDIDKEYIVMEAIMYIKADKPSVSMQPAVSQIEEPKQSGGDEVDAEH